MFLIAERHAKLSQNSTTSEEELHHSLIAIIMACCSLEAFINTYTMEKYWNIWETKEGIKIERMPVTDKWITITQDCNSEGKTFNKQEVPFLDFCDLIELRNSIVHYKVKPTSPIKNKTQIISDQDAELTAPRAIWAVNTAKLMMREFCQITKKPLSKYLE